MLRTLAFKKNAANRTLADASKRSMTPLAGNVKNIHKAIGADHAVATRGARLLKAKGLARKAGIGRVVKKGRVLKTAAGVAGRAIQTAARRGIPVAARVVRKALFKFRNELMPRAITLANQLKTEGTGQMDFAALIAAINALLAAVGVDALPDGTDETNLVPMLQGVALAIGQAEDQQDGGADDATEGDANATDTGAVDATGAALDGSQGNVKMSNRIRAEVAKAVEPLNASMAELKELITGQKVVEGETAKSKYMTFRNALGKSGVAEAVLAGKDKLAERLGWDPAVLEGLSPTIKMSNVGRSQATTEAPKLDGQGPETLSDDAVAQRLKARGIDPKFMPGYREAAKV